ncbi:GNAT family N-acetyltransferase [Georgenia sp. Z1344]|uniref:GNAT family N-acetyltransferase n=1 Tax=Georgenia sp. Z1344 TaxID=3416706 RepID=UPI003CEDB3AA
MTTATGGFLDGDLFYRAQAARIGARTVAESAAAGVGVGPDPNGTGRRMLAAGDVEEIVDLLLAHPVADLVSAQAPDGTLAALRRRAATDPGATAAAAPWLAMTTGRAWDLLAIDEAPARRPGEEHAELLPSDDAGAVVRDVLAEAYPDTWALQHVEDHDWTGYRDGDRWLAVMASSRAPVQGGGEVAVLSGLGTRPADRGRGVGSALTCAITRRELAAGARVVQLGTWADVDGPRRLYESLGFAHVQRVENIHARPAD